jgi:hypothetical protein
MPDLNEIPNLDKAGEAAKLKRQLLFVNVKITGVLAQISCRQRKGIRHWGSRSVKARRPNGQQT